MPIGFRDVELKDISMITRWKKDPYIKKMALDPEKDIKEEDEGEEIKKYIEGEKKGGYKIIQVDDAEDIGYIRVDWIDRNRSIAWLRFAIGEHRGEGYGSKCLKKFTDGLFEGGCVRIEAEVYRENIPSQRVLEKVGFKREGIKRNAHFDGEDYTDIYIYGIIKEDLDEDDIHR